MEELKFKILYLEDEEIVRQTVQSMLEFKKFNVKSCSDGMEALDILNEGFIPDIVVTDIKMPKMDGLSFIREVQKKDLKIPAIVTTAHTDTDFLMDAIELKINKFLIKPLKMDDLLESIQTIIDEQTLKIQLLQKEEENLNLQNEIIQQAKNAEVYNMFDNIIHQWNQPITVIGILASGNEYMLESGLELDNNQLLEDFKSINETISYMRETVDDFKEFISPKQMKTNFYANQTTDSLINIIQARAKGLNVKFTKEIPEDLLITGNKNHYRQVLLNLLNNALDEYERNKIEAPTINIKIEKNDTDFITIFVCDNAGGIPEDLLPDKIFEHKFSTKGKNGSGIGLSICKQIIENSFGGNISVKNNEIGACFELKLRVKN